MSFDGSGNYSVPAGTQAVGGAVIDSVKYNAFLTDLQTALSKALLRDGQGAAQNNIPMAGYKFTGLVAGSATGDSVAYEQIAPLKTFPPNTSFVTGEMNVLTTNAALNTGAAAGTYYAGYNNSASPITIYQGSGLTLRLAGTTLTGDRIIAARGAFNIWCLSTTEYILSGAGVS